MHVLLERQHHLGAAAEVLAVVGRHGERATGARLPLVLGVVVVFGNDRHLLGHQVRRVEADAKLANHRNVGARLERLHERLGARLGNRAQVVNEVGLGHPEARVANRERPVGLVGNELNVQVAAAVQDRGIRERLVANLVEGVAGVRDELAEEDVLVRVERVDDERQELVNVGREAKGLGVGRGWGGGCGSGHRGGVRESGVGWSVGEQEGWVRGCVLGVSLCGWGRGEGCFFYKRTTRVCLHHNPPYHFLKRPSKPWTMCGHGCV